MSIHHHPSDALMLDYGAGTIGPAAGLALGAHLALCPRCRGTHRILEAVGGHLLLCAGGEKPPPPGAFERIMARLEAEPAARHVPRPPRRTSLPAPLEDALGCDLDDVPWKRLGMGAYHYVIPLDDAAATARLLRIPAGRPVPVHTHRGLELTLVLRGAFSDSTGEYGPGDLQEADDTLEHQPHAAPGEDCVCLAVTEAPLRFRSWGARIAQPFLGI